MPNSATLTRTSLAACMLLSAMAGLSGCATESHQAPPPSSCGGLIKALAAAFWGSAILAALAVIGLWMLG